MSEPTKRISDLIIILERFNQVLVQENNALRNFRADEVKDLLEDKAALSRVYENRARALMKDPDALNETDEELRERLKALGGMADVLVAENARLLKVAIEAQKSVLETIKDAVKDSRSGPKTYSAEGASLRVNKRAGTSPMAIDESL